MLGGRYQRGAKVGVDSLGTIFQGLDTQVEQPVLLHYLGASASDDVMQGLIQRDREGRWADLPGGAPLLGYTRDPQGNRAVLVREGIAGQPLTSTLAGEPLPIGQALWLGERLLGVLQPLHEGGRVHGAIAPDVVYIEPTKWSLRLVQPLPSRTDLAHPPRGHDWLVLLAPEVIAGASDARPESDLYAVAALMYRALAGRPHLRAKTTVDLFNAIREGRFTPLREVAPTIELELALVIEEALRADPRQRPRTAADFRRSLAHLRDLK